MNFYYNLYTYDSWSFLSEDFRLYQVCRWISPASLLYTTPEIFLIKRSSLQIWVIMQHGIARNKSWPIVVVDYIHVKKWSFYLRRERKIANSPPIFNVFNMFFLFLFSDHTTTRTTTQKSKLDKKKRPIWRHTVTFN